MYSTIVVGTDGSDGAKGAVRVAADLARMQGQASVHVVAAYRSLTPAEFGEAARDLPKEFQDLLTSYSGVESTVADARAVLREVDVRAQFHEVADDPTDALLDTAEQFGADLIVVGSRGEGAAKRALHGSVSTKVLHHAPCSVLVVKSDE